MLTDSIDPALEVASMDAAFEDLAREISNRSYVPYSGRHVGVVAVLPSGDYIPGVRVESASFPLTIPALVNACSSVHAIGAPEPALFVKSASFSRVELAYLEALFARSDLVADHIIKVSEPVSDFPGQPIDPTYGLGGASETPSDLIKEARKVAGRAYAITSDFPVGCLLTCRDGSLIPGCNVEHAEWLFTLCAERNAIGTAVSYGLSPDTLYLSCLKDPNGTPCGACRQVLVEHAPEMVIWMDRGTEPPVSMRADQLLPNHFDGDTISHLFKR
jgi:homotetrameric cytidine deaminase